MSYGSETWIYLKSVQNMIDVFERWCYRRMLCISWTEHVTNEEVFNRANTKPTLLDGLLKRRLTFHGDLVRKCGITLDLMIGRLHGTRPRGRPRTTWLKDLATQANISYKPYREMGRSGGVSATLELVERRQMSESVSELVK